MAKKYSAQDIQAIQNRKIFFDANILIYLFWQSSSNFWENKYSTIYSKLLKQGNEMFVDFIVISEVANRAIRLEYEKHLLAHSLKKDNCPFKTYRNNSDGQKSLEDIYRMIETDILSRFSVVGKSFSKQEIQSLLTVDNLDFVDKGILSICQENNYILLTNDIDYKTSNIDVLTSNPAFSRN